MAVAVIKAKCTPEFKDKFSKFADKKGETDSALVRKALIKMMNEETKKLP